MSAEARRVDRSATLIRNAGLDLPLPIAPLAVTLRLFAGAVGAALRELGLSKHESASASASLLEFTKELFLDEWMSQIEEGEDSEVVLAEGKEEFGRCLVQPSA